MKESVPSIIALARHKFKDIGRFRVAYFLVYGMCTENPVSFEQVCKPVHTSRAPVQSVCSVQRLSSRIIRHLTHGGLFISQSILV